jgi:hypothetical protein
MPCDLHELAVKLARRFNEGNVQELERELVRARNSGELSTYLARLWRIDRFARFKDRQLRKREWINFREITDWCSELGGGAERDEARRSNAYSTLRDDLLAGDFEDAAGKSCVLYLHHRSTRVRMTRENWLIIEETHSPDIARSQFLDRCWLPRHMFQHWLARRELPLSPPRFEPRVSETTIMPPQQVVSREAATAIETSPRQTPGRKPYAIDAVRAYISKHYPVGVPPNVTHKKIGKDFEESEGGFKVSPRTVSRALGGK